MFFSLRRTVEPDLIPTSNQWFSAFLHVKWCLTMPNLHFPQFLVTWTCTPPIPISVRQRPFGFSAPWLLAMKWVESP